MVQLCQAVPHASNLDVGAGEGSVLGRLADLGFGDRSCAIELSESALRRFSALATQLWTYRGALLCKPPCGAERP